MNDKTSLTETIEALQKEFSIYTDKSKTPYENISSQGHHLVDIGEHVEAWLLEKHCFLFEDRKCIGGFNHSSNHESIGNW